MIIYNQLVLHVSSQLHHLQFDFLRGKSTTSQLLYILQDINKALENRGQVDSVYLDFAKTFDKVSHNLLLVKLHKFGITGRMDLNQTKCGVIHVTRSHQPVIRAVHKMLRILYKVAQNFPESCPKLLKKSENCSEFKLLLILMLVFMFFSLC